MPTTARGHIIISQDGMAYFCQRNKQKTNKQNYFQKRHFKFYLWQLTLQGGPLSPGLLFGGLFGPLP